MIIHSGFISPKQIVVKEARRNKDYDIEFVNTETNSDTYELELYLRKFEEGNYKIKLTLMSRYLSAPALEMVWIFEEEEYELASRVFHRICDEVDEVKTHYDGSMMPASTLAAQIREYVKPISMNHREKTNIPTIDESHKEAGVSDWRNSLYGDRYPNLTSKEKAEFKKFEGNEIEKPLDRKEYGLREKY